MLQATDAAALAVVQTTEETVEVPSAPVVNVAMVAALAVTEVDLAVVADLKTAVWPAIPAPYWSNAETVADISDPAVDVVYWFPEVTNEVDAAPFV